MTQNSYIRSFPRVVRIEPAGACNLRCSHCPTGTVNMKRGIMKPETFSIVLHNIQVNVDSIKVVVLYHGGEPLLHKSFPEMVRQIKALGVPLVKTVSNGMLLTEATMADIISSGLDEIEFSLDGESPEENDFIRRNCDYATVVRNIKHFIQYKRKKKLKTPKIFISSTQFLTREVQCHKDMEPKAPDYLIKEFSGKYSVGVSGFKCTYAMRWPHMVVLEDIYETLKDPQDTKITNYCDHVLNTMTVRWNGDVVPCCYDLTSRCILGNIHQDDLMTIWNNNQYQRLRQSIATMNFIPICADCNVVKQNVYLTFKPEVMAKFQKAEQ